MSGVAGLVVAAGSGVRFGGDVPKTFVPLAGKPMFVWSLQAMEAAGVDMCVLVVPAGYVTVAEQICRRAALQTVSDIVEGGPRRLDSVFNGLQALRRHGPEIVAIHDGARPLVTPELIRRCLADARLRGAAVAATPVTDTLKRTTPQGRVAETPDRSAFWRAQTPQTFSYRLILKAYEQFRSNEEGQGCAPTDDASIVEAQGQPVYVTEGDPTNIKVTTTADLRYAEMLLAEADAGQVAHCPVRVGYGFDVHRLVEGRALILGGVELEFERGLEGHSDADVLFHAISDALLGAIAAGDIGRHFPDTDPQYRDADSSLLAAEVARMVGEAGFRIGNVDATVVCEAPRLAGAIERMRRNIAQALGISEGQVSVKATTTEGLGYTGRGEGIAAYAVASVCARAASA